ncbi:MAG: YraN family protein [Filomicrobium sp.]
MGRGTSQSGGGSQDASSETTTRRQRYKSGLAAERTAAIWLFLKGYVVLGARVRTPAGEIDLIATRGKRIAFVEVKRRRTLELAEASVTAKQRQRTRHAADLWLAKHPRYQEHTIGFDLIFLLPWHLPIHLPNAL